MTEPPWVFLNYAREDAESVTDIYRRLREAGLRPWMDTQDIVGGEDWERSIRRALRRADFFVACLSRRSSTKRGFLQKELKEALEIWKEKLPDDIYLIPARLEDCDLPSALGGFHRVDLFEEDGFARLFKAIDAGLQRQNDKYTQTESRDARKPTGHRLVTNRISESDPERRLYTLEVAYPRIEPVVPGWVEEVNYLIAGWAVEHVQSFRKDSLAIGTGLDPFALREGITEGLTLDELSVSYDVRLFDEDLLSLIFTISRYGAGAAHPNHWFETFNFQLRPPVQLGLPDLFVRDSNYVSRISELCIQDIARQWASDDMFQDEQVRAGADPDENNFENFSLSRDSLIISFDPYQVGPYAMGVVEVVIPYASLRGLLDERGPLAGLLR